MLYAAEELVAVPDSHILQAALQQNRVVLTFDQDFGELVFHHREPPPPGVVLFRLGGLSPDGLLAFLRAFFEGSSRSRVPATFDKFQLTYLERPKIDSDSSARLPITAAWRVEQWVVTPRCHGQASLRRPTLLSPLERHSFR